MKFSPNLQDSEPPSAAVAATQGMVAVPSAAARTDPREILDVLSVTGECHAIWRKSIPASPPPKTSVVSAAPYRRQASRDGSRKGVQIDLLIQARKSICLVEIKRRREIGRNVIDEVAEKVASLPRRRDVTVRTALVYEGHLAPIVEADGYFDAIIPFSKRLRI